MFLKKAVTRRNDALSSLFCAWLMMIHWSARGSSKLAFAALFALNDEVIVMAHGTLHNDVTMVSCIVNCKCSWPSAGDPRLEIDCVDRTRGNSSSTAKEIDRLLAGKESELNDLTVINSPLAFVPSSICRLKHLKRLTLNTNRLTSLPSRCFNNMTNLVDLYVVDNSLTQIQDGLFDGMSSLKLLVLSHNRISTIGSKIFTEKAGLVSLHDINIESNELTELDPWPFIRGQLVPGSVVSLMWNRIANFTNGLGWGFRCGITPHVNLELNLLENSMRHLTDMFDGWNVTGLINQLCIFVPESLSSLYLRFSLEVCDCIDYEFYSAARMYQNSSLLSHQFCKVSENILISQINSVPLDQFVCKVDELACPTGCHCTKIPYNRTFVVRCPHINTMPITLPDTQHPGPFKCRYALDFSASEIRNIDCRDYFNNTVVVDVSRSLVDNITDDAWRALSRVERVDLSTNKLTVLPTILLSENLTFKSIALYGNPWRCECEDKWIKSWMSSLGDGLLLPESILCASPTWLAGKNIMSINDEEDFCDNPDRKKTIKMLEAAVPSAVGSAIVITCLVSLMRKYRVALFVRFDIHPFDIDECDGENMIYDAYLVHAEKDCEKGRDIFNRLEQDKFTVGSPELVQFGTPSLGSIGDAINKSKRVVFLLTNAFIRCQNCAMIFRDAMEHCRKLNKRRLVVIKWPEVDEYLCRGHGRSQVVVNCGQLWSICTACMVDGEQPSENDPLLGDRNNDINVTDLRMFLSTYECVQHDRGDWWQHLMYALPRCRLKNQSVSGAQNLL